MLRAILLNKSVLVVSILMSILGNKAMAANNGILKEFCESDKVVHYFYTNEGSKDVSYYISYNKLLRRNILARSLKAEEGNELLRNFKQTSRMGINVRCHRVDHYFN